MKKHAETTTTPETIEVLNDLVAINNDRIAGDEKAIEEAKETDSDLKTLFTWMIDESRKINTRTFVKGQCRIWLTLKNDFFSHSGWRKLR